MATDARSLRVPASVVQRVLAVWRWIAPSALAATIATGGIGWRWFESRASRTDVGELVASASAEAKAAKATAFHAESLTTAHAGELRALWVHVVALRAELVVLRAYGKSDAPTRSAYITEAQAFYEREFQTQLRTNAHDPAEAARLALQAKWRPDR